MEPPRLSAILAGDQTTLGTMTEIEAAFCGELYREPLEFKHCRIKAEMAGNIFSTQEQWPALIDFMTTLWGSWKRF